MSIIRGPYSKPYVTRDGKPLDFPEGADKPTNGFLYERPSNIAGNLDTQAGLKAYQQAKAVCGVIKDKGLAWQFRALVSEYEDPWVSAKDTVKDLLRQAERIGGEATKSNIGSSLHRLAHLRDISAEILYPVPQLEPWLDCYDDVVRSRYEVLDDEVFVVCDDLEGGEDDLRAAGSFDRLLRDKETGEVLVGDIKGGADVDQWVMSPTIQMAIYAHSRRYCQETGERTPIHADLNTEKGLLIHVPVNGGGTPRATIHPLDLREGFRLAKMSADLTKARRMKCYKKNVIAHVEVAK